MMGSRREIGVEGGGNEGKGKKMKYPNIFANFGLTTMYNVNSPSYSRRAWSNEYGISFHIQKHSHSCSKHEETRYHTSRF
jgi:hypothetical protein